MTSALRALGAIIVASAGHPAAPQVDSIPVLTFGQSMIPLTGPWRFHTGDDSTWSRASYDDASWETVSLVPAPGAHDSDVGLTGYVEGWTSRGHAGYSGFAWYRLRVAVTGVEDSLAIAGPALVDDAYQLYVNGRLLGGVGTFRSGTPITYNTTPQVFRIPASSGRSVLLIAIRTWMAPGTIGTAPEVGGVHIAPVLGMTDPVQAHYRVEWIELVRGYFLELLQAAAFLVLAVGALGLARLSQVPRPCLWIAAGLSTTAVMRAVLALAAWTTWLSAPAFDLLERAFVIPSMISAWCLAWWWWSDGRNLRWVPKTVAAAMLIYAGVELFAPTRLHALAEGARLALAVAYAVTVWTCAQASRRGRWLMVASAILIGVGLFASELSALHLPGIWFPYGTGVSRTQFAYAGADVTLALLFWRMLAPQRIPG